MLIGKRRKSRGSAEQCVESVYTTYSLPSKITVVLDFHVTSLTRFIENMCNIYIPNKFIKKIRFKDFFSKFLSVSILSKMTVVLDFHVTSLTRFIENMCNIYISK